MSESTTAPDEKWLRRKSVTAFSPASMRTVIEVGEAGALILDEPVSQGGSGEGPTPLQTVLAALCGCEAVTFRRTASDFGFAYESLTFDGAFSIDIRGRMGDRSVRQHFKTVQLRIEVATDEDLTRLAEVVVETEARCPVMNLLADANVDLTVNWWRAAAGETNAVPRLQST